LSIPGGYFKKFNSPIYQIGGGNMKKLTCVTFIILVAIATVANAEEAPISPFIGTWGGRWADPTGQKKETFVGTIKLNGDGKGGIIVESWESAGGKKINLETPPKVVQNSPDEILILWPNGNKTTLKLNGSVIRAENNPVNSRPWSGVFNREK
jgi:hypothetical protein